MDVQNNNISIQIHAKDLQGKTLRVADCDVFILHVFTNDPAFYLSFSGRDMLATEMADELTIPKKAMEQLRSGVVQYTYHYLPKAVTSIPDVMADEIEDIECLHHPHHHHHPHCHNDFLDEELINSKPVVTSIYWRNLSMKHCHDEHDMRNHDIHRVHRLLDIEIMNRMKADEEIKNLINGEINDKFDVEADRSKEEDKRLNDLVENLQSKTDELAEQIAKHNEEVDNKLDEIGNAVDDEVTRAKASEADIEIKVKQEETARIGGDEILDAKLTMEKERATANEQNLADRISSVSEKFESFKSIQTDALSSEIVRAKETESGLNRLIQTTIDNLNAEISRSAQKDIEHENLVKTEANRAMAVENKIEENLTTEINRAKDAEKHILDEVHELQDNVYTKSEVDNKVGSINNDVSDLKNKVDAHISESDVLSSKVASLNNDIATLQNEIDNHNVTSSELQTKVSSLVADVDKAKSDILVEIAKCDAENDKLATEIKTLSDSTYTKAETDNLLNDVNSSIASLENWKDNHSDNTDELNKKVSKLIEDTDKLSTDLSTEITDRTNADLTISTKIEIVDGKIVSEIERAKAVESTLKTSIDELNDKAENKHSELSDSIAETNANLTLEIARAKAAEKVLSDAVEVINGDVDTVGSIKKSLADSKNYTDTEIIKLSLAKDVAIADTLKVYATKDDVDKKISDVIGSAPDALDTLGKISEALSQDTDAITAINEVLSGKANSSDVYTKNEVDTKVTSINNNISTLETKVDNADLLINGRIDDLNIKVNSNEATVNDKITSLQTSIDDEVTRAKAQEKAINDKVTSEVDKLNDKISDLNAKVIQDIADSTAKDIELTAMINTNSETIATEVTRAKQVEKEINDKINTINLDATNSNLSSEIDRATAAEATIQSNLDSEIARATVAETTLTTSISDEVSRAKAAEKQLSDKIDSIDLTTVINSVSSLGTKVDNEIARAKNAEKINYDNITNLQTSVGNINDMVTSLNASLTQLSADSIAKDNQIESDLATEKTRAENAEKLLSDKIDVINGDKDTVGSIAHAVQDANHYTDDEISKLKGIVYTKEEVDNAITNIDVTEQLNDYTTKQELQEAIDAIQVGSEIDLSDYYNKSEINTIINYKIDSIDFPVPDLSDYYNKSEVDEIINTKIDSIDIPEVDLSEYYNKSEVDEKIDSIEFPETDLSDYYNKTEVDEKIDDAKSEILGGAGNDYDTLKEIETWVLEHQDLYNALIAAIALKATKTELQDAIDELSEKYYTKEEVEEMLAWGEY